MSVRSNTAAQLAQDMQRVGNAAVQAKQTYDKGVLTTIKNKWDEIYTEFKREISMSNDFGSYDQIAEKYQAEMQSYVDEIKAPTSVRNYLNGTYYPGVKNQMQGYVDNAYVSGYYNDAATRWSSYITKVGSDGNLSYAQKEEELRKYYSENGIGTIPKSIVSNVQSVDDAIQSMQGISVQQAAARYYAENDPASLDFRIDDAVDYALASIANADGISAITDNAMRASLEKTTRDYIAGTLESNLNEKATNVQESFSSQIMDSIRAGDSFTPEQIYDLARQQEGAVDQETGSFSRQWAGFFGNFESAIRAKNDLNTVLGIDEDTWDQFMTDFNLAYVGGTTDRRYVGATAIGAVSVEPDAEIENNNTEPTATRDVSAKPDVEPGQDDIAKVNAQVTEPEERSEFAKYLSLDDDAEIYVKAVDGKNHSVIIKTTGAKIKALVSDDIDGIYTNDDKFSFTLDELKKYGASTSPVSGKITDSAQMEGLKWYFDRPDTAEYSVQFKADDGSTLDYTLVQSDVKNLIYGTNFYVDRGGKRYVYTPDDFIADYVNEDAISRYLDMKESSESSVSTARDYGTYDAYHGTTTYSFSDGYSPIVTAYGPLVNAAIEAFGVDPNSREAIQTLVDMAQAEGSRGNLDSPDFAAHVYNLRTLYNDPSTTTAAYDAALVQFMYDYGIEESDLKSLGLDSTERNKFKSFLSDNPWVMDRLEFAYQDAMYPKNDKGERVIWSAGTKEDTIKEKDFSSYLSSTAERSAYYQEGLLYAQTLLQEAFQSNPLAFSGTPEANKELNTVIDGIMKQVANRDLVKTINKVETYFSISGIRDFAGIFNNNIDDVFSQVLETQAFVQPFYDTRDANHDLYNMILTPKQATAAVTALIGDPTKPNNLDWTSDEALDVISNALSGRDFASLSPNEQLTVKMARAKAYYEKDLQDSIGYLFKNEGVDPSTLLMVSVLDYGPAYVDPASGKYYMTDGNASTAREYWTGTFTPNQVILMQHAKAFGENPTIAFSDLPSPTSVSNNIERKKLTQYQKNHSANITSR